MEINRANKNKIAIIELPILVDVNEQGYVEYQKNNPYVLYAGSPYYDQTIDYILVSMNYVWRFFPNCKLVITGMKPNDVIRDVIIGKVKKYDNVDLVGYLTREELLKMYSQASALLIPLFDDVRSKQDFPRK